VLAVSAALWVIGDLVYSRVVAHQVKSWEENLERDARGVQQACDAYTVGQGETALLFVHGINSSPRCFDNMTAALAKRGFTCRAMRLPGFAQPIDEYERSQRDDWIASVNQQLTSLREGHACVGIVAHSLGGAVAIGQLLEHPESADFAVLLAPAIEVSNRRSPLLSARAWHEIGQHTLVFTQATWSPFGPDCHDPTAGDFPGRSPATPLSVVDELFALLDENRGRAKEFRTPLLVAFSEDDRVVDWRSAVEFFEQSASHPKQLITLANCGHAIPLDYDWPRVADAIAAFAVSIR
jgi:esterase/lipase